MKLYFVAFILLAPAIVFAQPNFQQGYILKNSGDTLKGYIDYREWMYSPRSVDFKFKKEDVAPIKFGPQAIRGFAVSGAAIYWSYIGTVSQNKTDLTDLSQRLDTNRKVDTVFIKQLVAGKNVTLFYQRDNIKVRYFIAGQNEKPVELINIFTYDEHGSVSNSAIYKGQLILYIEKYKAGNEKIKNKLERINYAEDDLESVADDINGTKSVVNKKSNFRFHAGAGLNDITTKFENLNSTNVTQTANTIAPEINAGFDVFNDPDIQQLVFRVNLFFTGTHPSFTTTGIQSTVVNTPKISEVYSFDQYTMGLNPQILFNFYNKDNFKIFIDGGIAFNFAAYSNNKFTSQNSSVVNNPVPAYEPYYTSFPLYAGVTINRKIEISLCYTGYASYAKYIYLNASNQTLGLGFKYLFSR